MGIVDNALMGASGQSGYNLTRSLRFRSSASAYLSRTPASAGNRQIFTLSAWVKRGKLTSEQAIIVCRTGSSTEFGRLVFNSSDQLDLWIRNSSSTTLVRLVTTQVFRDPSAWYHVVMYVDTTQATAANRAIFYINGVQVTAYSTATYPSQNTNLDFNTANLTTIGVEVPNATYLDGYLAEVNFIDGQALTPSSFGSTNTLTGVWQPARYTGTYGTNGFYLPFTDNSSVLSLGYDLKPGSSHLATSTIFVVPSYSSSLIVELWGGGAGGGGGGATFGNSGGVGTASTFAAPGGTLSAGGGTGGTGVYRTDLGSPSGTGVSGSGGTASGGDVNTNGNSIATTNASTTGAGAPNGGGNTATASSNAQAFAGTYPGGAGSGGVYLGPGQPTGGAGGSGAYVKKTYSSGALTPGSSITVALGTAGAGGTSDAQNGAPGAAGAIRITVDGVATNDWYPNNISVTAGVTYDSMTDVPTLTSATAANFAVLNPLNNSGTLANANLTWNGTDRAALGTMALPITGKYYFEATCTTVGNFSIIGIADGQAASFNGVLSSANFRTYNSGGEKADSTRTASWGSTFTSGDVIGIAVDMDNGAIYFAKNNTWQASGVPTSGASKTGAAFTDLISSGKTWVAFVSSTNNNGVWNANHGQRPFTYTPPTGFVALNTYNLPTSTIVKGNTVMDATLWTGDSTYPRSITNAAGFKPDLVWVKSRSTAYSHILYDSVRGTGTGANLSSDSTGAEGALSSYANLTAYNSNGFSVGSTSLTNILNNSGQTFVGWQWQAGQGTNTTNTNGSITSTVSVNASAGFSVVTYTGTGANATVGHGLGVAPSLIIVKQRNDSGTNWLSYHVSLGATQGISLDSISATNTSSTYWNNTAPTSSVFSLGTTTNVNRSTGTYVAYCWTPIAGYSAFGSYTGNSSTDGPFVYTGFRPKYLLVRRTDAAASWLVFDSARDTYNAVTKLLRPNLADAEATSADVALDFLSNGFKLRQTSNNINTGTIIYMAFAENPFKNSLAR